jgi:hypothetical protein
VFCAARSFEYGSLQRACPHTVLTAQSLARFRHFGSLLTCPDTQSVTDHYETAPKANPEPNTIAPLPNSDFADLIDFPL